jgi:hypothetical protein
MAKKTAYDAFLAECEPFFLDGVHTIAQFAQRTQEIVRDAVDRRWASLVEALGFTKDETALLNYWEPDKLQRAEPTDGISVGVKFKVPNLFEAGIYRYWIVEEKATGIEAWTWIKRRTQLDRLSKELDDAEAAFPEPDDSWNSSTNSIGTYFITRKLEQSEISQLDVRLDEFLTYYIDLVTKVGGVKKFLSSPPSDTA